MRGGTVLFAVAALLAQSLLSGLWQHVHRVEMAGQTVVVAHRHPHACHEHEACHGHGVPCQHEHGPADCDEGSPVFVSGSKVRVQDSLAAPCNLPAQTDIVASDINNAPFWHGGDYALCHGLGPPVRTHLLHCLLLI